VTAEQRWLRSFCCGYIRWKMLQHLLPRLRSVPCIYSFLDIHLFKVSLKNHTSTFTMSPSSSQYYYVIHCLFLSQCLQPLQLLLLFMLSEPSDMLYDLLCLSITCVNIKWNSCIRIDQIMKSIQDWMHRRNSRLISAIYHHRNKTPRFWQDIFNQSF
jgi:hypothetical protein